ncbi:MAG: FAD-dependent oxidoreductase [Candidatus Micrarchaeaceae archaeon]
MKKLLIVGAGDGGIILANALHGKEFEITLLDPEQRHYFQPLLLSIAFKGAKEKSILKSKLLPRNAKLINAKVNEVDLNERKVTTTDGRAFYYDYVVVDTGSKGDYTKIPGHSDLYNEFGDFHSDTAAAMKLHEKVTSFKGGKAVIGITYPIYKCPPSPMEAALLFEEYINKHGLKDKTEITFITPYPRAYPAEPMNEVVEPIFKKRNINTLTFFDVESIDNKAHKITSIEGDTISYDFAAMVPPHRGAGLVKGMCDADGFVKTDKYTLNIEGYDDAFCIGDATAIATAKSGVTAHLEAMVVKERLLGRDVKFNGRTNCPLETGYGKGTFVIGSYDAPVLKKEPTRLNYMLKLGMAKLAWPALTGKMNWFFDLYFKATDPAKHASTKQQPP